MKITARTLSGRVCHVEIEDHVFKKITPEKEDLLDLPWIAPGLVDIQINGFAGVDFNRPIESDAAWRHATQQLYAHGCTGFLIALITSTGEAYRALLTDLSGRINLDPRNCLGFHMEGPWLNPDPGYRGAHRAEWMQKPGLRLLEEWWAIAGPLLKLITIAPEIDPEAAAQVIRAGVEKKIQFFLGHSAAMGETLRAAVDAGAIGWTHLGNAMPATVPKFENVILHALAQPGLFASLIPDGLHLPPHAFRVLARALGQAHPSRLLLTTDAMAGAGVAPGAGAKKPGTYTLGDVQVEVGADGSARLPDSGRLAGSTLTPFQGAFLAERMAGLFLEDAWTAFSTRPASLLGLNHGLAEGNSADFCLLSPEKTPYLLATYHRGKCVYEAP
ncbi:MAG TPA: N-acetylglucosamine-6-phosphate deacetylase [Candidatus Methylacidiphilales bacterium]|jgi:N-acetylglucosamine-6-phosphate deacetylase|nr:N-acetylglucosamine-6-phosphate deacetylase [Candidatus Methylacidiphilales bacterium]